MLQQLRDGVTSLFTHGKAFEVPPLDYTVPPSFASHLPWVDIDDNDGIVELEDGRSVGAFFSITPVSTEDKKQKNLNKIVKNLTNTFGSLSQGGDDNPWIIQIFARDVDNFGDVVSQLKAKARVKDAFTDAVLAEDAKHFSFIGREQGIFSVDNRPWRGRDRQVIIAIYRWLPKDTTNERVRKNIKQLKALQRRLLLPSSFKDYGVSITKAYGEDVFNWLAPFLNPSPMRGESHFYRKQFSPIDRDYSERLLRSRVTADLDNGLWWFKGEKNIANRVVELDTWDSDDFLAGCVFGEVSDDDDTVSGSVVFDELPPGTMMAMTLVPQSKEKGRDRLKAIQKAAVGDEPEIRECKEQCDNIDELINRNTLWRGQVSFYIQGESVNDIECSTDMLRSAFNRQGLHLRFVSNSDQVAPLDSFLRWLPMNYNPDNDPHYWYCGWVWLEDMLRLSPLFGRSTGTGSNTFSFFNRGGELLGFDPLEDYLSNAHLVLFGPSGSGKSATLVGMCLRLLAIHRPRLFIIEAGNSFGLLGDFCERHGLSVNRIEVKASSPGAMAPFADAHHLVGQDIPQIRNDDALKPENLNNDDSPDDEERDILGELEIMARLMITGGEKRELDDYRRADSSMVRQALKLAAEQCHQDNVMVRPTHVKNALLAFSQDSNLPEERRQRARAMADSMAFFCEGLEGKIFDSEGEPWPEVDVTIIDLGLYAKEGYDAQLATAYISLINKINFIAERDQYDGIPIVALTDEGHLFSANELLAPYGNKITKMWRKLEAWNWVATQDLADYPLSSRKMLNNSEWWVMLNMSEDELNTLKTFKKLSPEEEDLIRSMTAEDGKFKEGVVMGMNDTLLSRFCVVPPALYLALGETDGKAKKKRADFMVEHGCNELDAALLKSSQIEQARESYQGDLW